MQDNSILEPIDLYNKQFKDKFRENTEKYFDDLVKKTNTDVEKNREYVKKYNLVNSEIKTLNSKAGKNKAFKWFFIILIIVLVVVGILAALGKINEQTAVKVGVPIGSILLAILLIVGVVKFSKVIKKLNEIIAKKQKEADGYLAVCKETMQALNSKYDWNIPSDLMEMTTPLIDLDHVFDVNKFQYLHEKFGFEDNNDPDCSTNYVISGNISGNPFVLLNTFNTEMVDKEYTGSLVIHWTTLETGSDGKTRTVSHSETLYAHSTHPAATYFYDTRLVFGNEAAPDLSFTRKPTVKAKPTEKDLRKIEDHARKELQGLAEKSISKGGNFTPLANSKFEGMFHAYDRDNEQQFRLLFTPLAQKNLINLLAHGEYGDDFYFYKKNCLNYIFSKHSQDIDYNISPSMFFDYDIDHAKQKFIDINTTFFKGLYFDLAPLLSIPVYQQTKTHEYIYDIPYEAYHTKYEQEALANRFNKADLINPLSKTDAIIKCKFNSKDDDGDDFVSVHAYSYDKIKRVDFIPTLGGDGRMHNVPVEWYEYIPLEQVSQMAIADANTTRDRFNNSNELINELASDKKLVYERGLVSMLLLGNHDIKDIKNKILKKDEEK